RSLLRCGSGRSGTGWANDGTGDRAPQHSRGNGCCSSPGGRRCQQRTGSPDHSGSRRAHGAGGGFGLLSGNDGAGPADAHTGRSIRGDAVRGIRRTAAGVLPPVPIPSARDGGGAGGSNRHGRGFGIKRTRPAKWRDGFVSENSYSLQLLEPGSALLAVPDNDSNVSHSSADTDDVGGRPGNMEADLCIGNEGHCNKGVPSTGNQGDPHPLGLAVLEHPYGDTQECEQGQGLVGPCEVTPQQIESIGAALRKDQNHSHQREDDGGQAQALRLGA
ncbi:hypothetical protein BBBGCB_BBBGCB_02355, partial [Dysosmobacter welbionis]